MRTLRVTVHARRPGASGACALLLALLFAAAGVGAQDTSVTFLEGFPELRSAGGQTFDLDFGDAVDQGDSVVTGRGDFVELRQGEGTTIRVESDTVFTLREVAEGGSRQSVMTNSVGEVRYRFNRLAGREPRVGSAAVVAGIRGTELTIYAGSDGSTLFLVDSGLVEVTSGGETVELSEAQAVEVGAGQPPGEVFEWRGRELDFSSWDQSRLDSFIDEPARSVELLLTRLEEFAEGYQEYRTLWEEFSGEFETVLEEFRALEDETERERFRQEELFPLRDLTTTQALNYRYFSLSALSLRRHVLGRMYMTMKTLNIMNPENEEFQAFLEEYEAFLDLYEQRITPGLVPADI
ncbi:MAG: FecR domain-containing protein [Spirochaetaceae bacterium]